MSRQIVAAFLTLSALGSMVIRGPGTGEPVADGTNALPAPRIDSDVSLEWTLQHRESTRTFAPDEALSLEQASQLLWAAQGVTRADGKRTAPSAGALYPLEITLVAGRVSGLDPGVYRYQPSEHDLVRHREGALIPDLARSALDQMWIADAPAVFVVSGVHERTTGKYGERGVRYVQIEAGHAAQNLVLQATALHLGATTVGAFADDDLSELLGLREEEEPLYMLPVGRKQE
jgi:SagB-type dehydrogenase family enzyme